MWIHPHVQHSDQTTWEFVEGPIHPQGRREWGGIAGPQKAGWTAPSLALSSTVGASICAGIARVGDQSPFRMVWYAMVWMVWYGRQEDCQGVPSPLPTGHLDNAGGLSGSASVASHCNAWPPVASGGSWGKPGIREQRKGRYPAVSNLKGSEEGGSLRVWDAFKWIRGRESPGRKPLRMTKHQPLGCRPSISGSLDGKRKWELLGIGERKNQVRNHPSK